MPAVIVPIALAAAGAVAKHVAAKKAAKAQDAQIANANRLAAANTKRTTDWQAGLNDPNSTQGALYGQMIGDQVSTTTGTYNQSQDTTGQSGATLSPEFADIPGAVQDRYAQAGARDSLGQAYRNAAIQEQGDRAQMLNTAALGGPSVDVQLAATGGGPAAAARSAARSEQADTAYGRRTQAFEGVKTIADMLKLNNFNDQSKTRGNRGSRGVSQGDYGGALNLTRPPDQQIFA